MGRGSSRELHLPAPEALHEPPPLRMRGSGLSIRRCLSPASVPDREFLSGVRPTSPLLLVQAMSKLSMGVQRIADAEKADDPAVTALVRLGEADRALAAAVDLASAVPLVRQAKMVRDWAQAVDAGRRHKHQADVFVLRAMRNAGERIKAAQDRGELATPGDNQHTLVVGNGDNLSTLPALGVTRDESSEWKSLAEAYTDPELAEVALDMERPSLAGALRVGKSRLAGMMTSDSGEWYTPPEVVAAVVAAMGAIDLDPCADPGRAIPATAHFVQDDDGLSQPWRGRVYMNPPYGREIGDWTEKLVTEFEYRNVAEAVALVPGRIDTVWYRGLTERASATVCHVAGRLRFSEADPAPFPSVAVHLGDDPDAFVAAFRSLGRSWRVLPE